MILDSLDAFDQSQPTACSCNGQPTTLPADWLADQFVSVARMLSGMGYTHAEADDAAQDAVVIALEQCRPGKPGPTRNASGWLRTVAVRRAGRSRRRRLPCDASRMATIPAPACNDADREDEAAAVRQAIGRLRREWRDVLIFCDLCGNSRLAAAREFGVCIGEIGRRLTQARAALRESLAGRGFDPAGCE
jgi:DNA-directed RNA polymerase specialized sigma24 family protein